MKYKFGLSIRSDSSSGYHSHGLAISRIWPRKYLFLQWHKKMLSTIPKESYMALVCRSEAHLLFESLLLLQINWTLLRCLTHSCICQNEWNFYSSLFRFSHLCSTFFCRDSHSPTQSQFIFIVFVIQLRWDMWKQKKKNLNLTMAITAQATTSSATERRTLADDDQVEHQQNAIFATIAT